MINMEKDKVPIAGFKLIRKWFFKRITHQTKNTQIINITPNGTEPYYEFLVRIPNNTIKRKYKRRKK